MLGIVFAVIVVISFIFAIFSGNLCNMSGAILDAAGKAVTTTLTLVGAMSLWSGVMETLREAGAIRRLSRMLSPLTRVLSRNQRGKGRSKTPSAASRQIFWDRQRRDAARDRRAKGFSGICA